MICHRLFVLSGCDLRLSSGQHFAAVCQFKRIDGTAYGRHERQVVGRKHGGHVAAFFHADAVFASDGAA